MAPNIFFLPMAATLHQTRELILFIDRRDGVLMFAMYWHLESLSRWPLKGRAMGRFNPNQGPRKGAGIQCTVDPDRIRSRQQECNAGEPAAPHPARITADVVGTPICRHDWTS
jgi:hypothetical protein